MAAPLITLCYALNLLLLLFYLYYVINLVFICLLHCLVDVAAHEIKDKFLQRETVKGSRILYHTWVEV